METAVQLSIFKTHTPSCCSRIYKALPYTGIRGAQKCEIINNLKYAFLLFQPAVMLKLGLFHIGNRNMVGPYAQTPSNKYSSKKNPGRRQHELLLCAIHMLASSQGWKSLLLNNKMCIKINEKVSKRNGKYKRNSNSRNYRVLPATACHYSFCVVSSPGVYLARSAAPLLSRCTITSVRPSVQPSLHSSFQSSAQQSNPFLRLSVCLSPWIWLMQIRTCWLTHSKYCPKSVHRFLLQALLVSRYVS